MEHQPDGGRQSRTSRRAPPTYRVRPDLSQDQHIDGLPLGTRGGMLVQHTFPLDGEYTIKLRLWRNTFDLMRGMEDPHEIEIAMDGARLQLVTVGGREDFGTMAENPGTFGADLDRRLTVRLPVKAGTHTLWATTVLKSQAPRDDLIKPFLRTTVDGLDIMGDPSVDRMTIEGPFARDRPGDTRVAPQDLHLPAGYAPAADETGVRAAKILHDALRAQAYRKPVDHATLDALMGFYSAAARTAQLRSRHRVGAAVHPRQPGVPVPHRARSRRTLRPEHGLSRWTISRWRRGCRSFSGAAFPTSSC